MKTEEFNKDVTEAMIALCERIEKLEEKLKELTNEICNLNHINSKETCPISGRNIHKWISRNGTRMSTVYVS